MPTANLIRKSQRGLDERAATKNNKKSMNCRSITTASTDWFYRFAWKWSDHDVRHTVWKRSVRWIRRCWVSIDFPKNFATHAHSKFMKQPDRKKTPSPNGRCKEEWTFIVSSVIRLQYCLKCWLLTVIIYIPKGDKGFTQLMNRRPISLLSTFAEIVESFMKDTLQDFMEEKEAAFDAQFGFQKYLSATQQPLGEWSERFPQTTHPSYVCPAGYREENDTRMVSEVNKITNTVQKTTDTFLKDSVWGIAPRFPVSSSSFTYL